jgi:hypothetical protein
METKELQELLDISILAVQELLINGITSTQFCLSLWGELNKEGRQTVIVLLTKAHKRLGTKIRRAKLGQLNDLIDYCNQILTREAVLAGVYPQFRRQAAGLKNIFLEAIMARWNKNKRPGATMTVDEIAQVFRDALREQGLEGIKTIS